MVSGVEVPAVLVSYGTDSIVPGMRRPFADPQGKTWDYAIVAWIEPRGSVAYVYYANGRLECLSAAQRLEFLR
jgi:hypothetical protein